MEPMTRRTRATDGQIITTLRELRAALGRRPRRLDWTNAGLSLTAQTVPADSATGRRRCGRPG